MDSSVEEIEKLFKLDDSGIYEYTCKMIRPYCKGVVDIKIGLVLFQFLHEVGHWYQFMSLDKNVAAYTTWNYEQEKNNYTVIIKGNVKLWKWPAPQKTAKGERK